MSGAEEVILYILLPLVGCMLVLSLSLSPAREMLKCNMNNDLGDLNPLPSTAFMMTNVIFLAYSVMIDNVFILSVNCVLLMINMQLTLWGYRLASPDFRFQMECMLHGYGVVLMCVSFIFMFNDFDQSVVVCGYVAMSFNITVFVPPLLLMHKVIKAHNSAPIFAPFAAVAVINCGFWTLYGLLIGSLPVAIPNAIGLVLSCIQLGLVVAYPANKDSVVILSEEKLTVELTNV